MSPNNTPPLECTVSSPCRQSSRKSRWLDTPARMFGIVLSGMMEFETSDGCIQQVSAAAAWYLRKTPQAKVIYRATQREQHWPLFLSRMTFNL